MLRERNLETIIGYASRWERLLQKRLSRIEEVFKRSAERAWRLRSLARRSKSLSERSVFAEATEPCDKRRFLN